MKSNPLPYKIYHVRAFPKTPNGGNLAGVCLHADSLTKNAMQQIAKEIGYSETAFVKPSKSADFKIQFFTPLEEVNLCGHATIATFNTLRDLGHIHVGYYTQETKAGILRLNVKEHNVFMEQPLPIYSEILPFEVIKDCFDDLSLSADLPIQILSTGMREIFLPVADKSALDMLIPNHQEIIRLSKQYDVIGIHAFCRDLEVDAYGRNFAPIVGIKEESATGTSNGALGCYFYKHITKKNIFTFRQGYSMNQPSEIVTQLTIDQSMIQEVWVGGKALIKEKKLTF